MKKTFVFMASALFVALMAVSCNDAPKEEAIEEEAAVEETATVEEPVAEEAAVASTETKTEAVDFNAYLDEYEKLVVSYEELAENGGIDKAKEVKQNAEVVKAKIVKENLDDAQLARFSKLNERMVNASAKIAKKTADSAKEGVEKGKDAANKIGNALGKKN